jgi:hypothetical protein
MLIFGSKIFFDFKFMNFKDFFFHTSYSFICGKTHECHMSNKILAKDFNLGACGFYCYVCIPKSNIFTKKY